MRTPADRPRRAVAGLILALMIPGAAAYAADAPTSDDAAAPREETKAAAKAARDAAKAVQSAVEERVGAASDPNAPAPPEPPMPPEPPEPPAPGVEIRGLHIRAGETHKGDIYQFAPSASIEGTQQGDVYLWAPSAHISGTVTGDVFFAGSELDISGEVKKSVRSFGATIVVDGTVGGNLLATGGSLTLGAKSHVKGNVSAFTGQMTHQGVVDGTLKFAGGTIVLAGSVGQNADLTADTIQLDKGAKIGGSVSYSARNRIDDEMKAIAGGPVSFDERPIDRKERKEEAEERVVPTRFGFAKWTAFLIASFLFGCAFVALFRAHEVAVLDAIRKDALRSTGIGFVSLLVTIAVILSSILLLTIPLVVLYLVAYAILWYLARVPVAVWLGRAILGWVRRPSGPYLSLFVGLVALHLMFVVPVIGVLLHWVAVPLLGMGAMITTTIAFRQAKKAAAMAAATPPADSAQAS